MFAQSYANVSEHKRTSHNIIKYDISERRVSRAMLTARHSQLVCHTNAGKTFGMRTILAFVFRSDVPPVPLLMPRASHPRKTRTQTSPPNRPHPHPQHCARCSAQSTHSSSPRLTRVTARTCAAAAAAAYTFCTSRTRGERRHTHTLHTYQTFARVACAPATVRSRPPPKVYPEQRARLRPEFVCAARTSAGKYFI